LVNLTFMIKMCLKCIETEQNDGSIITVIFIFMRTTSQFKTKTCILHNSVTVRLRTFIFLDQSMADSFEMRSNVSTAWLLLMPAAVAKYDDFFSSYTILPYRNTLAPSPIWSINRYKIALSG
jgi:hypothetical protein